MSLDEVCSTWDTLGRTDPFWAVLTRRRSKHNRWDLEEFFATGRQEIREVVERATTCCSHLSRGRALDFGCGVGRLTQSLAEHFEEVVGVDIASSFVERAREYNRHGGRCQYLHNPRGDLSVLENGSFDFVYSNITLQHVPQQHSTRYVEEFFRILRPGGVAVFQMPAGWTSFDGTPSWCFRRLRWTCIAPLRQRWKRARKLPVMGMYPIARAKVEEIIARSQGRLLDVVENTAAGKGWVSFVYYAERE